MGSVMLVGLFLVLKYLGKEWINWLLSLYFALVGLYSVPHVPPSYILAQLLSKVDSALFFSPSLVWQNSRWAVSAGTDSPGLV